MSASILLLPAAAIAAAGAFLDIRDQRLPNWLCAALALAALTGLAFSQGAALLPWALLHAAVALVVGMLLFRLGAIGGGQQREGACSRGVEFRVTAAGPLGLLGWTSAAGLALLIAMAAGRRMLGRPVFLKGWAVPYGVAIAAGFWIALLRM